MQQIYMHGNVYLPSVSLWKVRGIHLNLDSRSFRLSGAGNCPKVNSRLSENARLVNKCVYHITKMFVCLVMYYVIHDSGPCVPSCSSSPTLKRIIQDMRSPHLASHEPIALRETRSPEMAPYLATGSARLGVSPSALHDGPST